MKEQNRKVKLDIQLKLCDFPNGYLIRTGEKLFEI